MTSLQNPAIWAAVVVGGLFVIAFALAVGSDKAHSRLIRREHVVASFAGLRLTPSHLIVGQPQDCERISLTGLTVGVVQTQSATGPDVVVTVRGADRLIERREPLSYGSGGEAQVFAVMFNRMSRAQRGMAVPAAISA